MRAKSAASEWKQIMIEVHGKQVIGSYSVDTSDWMTVRLDGGGSKYARGGPAAESVARLILSELHSESTSTRNVK